LNKDIQAAQDHIDGLLLRNRLRRGRREQEEGEVRKEKRWKEKRPVRGDFEKTVRKLRRRGVVLEDHQRRGAE
jgi:hypothetical protein